MPCLGGSRRSRRLRHGRPGVIHNNAEVRGQTRQSRVPPLAYCPCLPNACPSVELNEDDHRLPMRERRRRKRDSCAPRLDDCMRGVARVEVSSPQLRVNAGDDCNTVHCRRDRNQIRGDRLPVQYDPVLRGVVVEDQIVITRTLPSCPSRTADTSMPVVREERVTRQTAADKTALPPLARVVVMGALSRWCVHRGALSQSV